MGSVLSKKLSTREQMQRYEDEINSKQRYLAELQKSRSFLSFYLFGLLAAGVGALVAYLEDCYPGAVFVVVASLFGGFRMAVLYVRGVRLRMAEERLRTLREKQHALIKEYKKDNNFAFARTIVDRYEEEENKESFFKQVQRKKKDAVERIADYVLANDPSKMNALICRNCGLHNGLLDPASRDVQFFYCYSCKARNNRAEDKAPVSRPADG